MNIGDKQRVRLESGITRTGTVVYIHPRFTTRWNLSANLVSTGNHF